MKNAVHTLESKSATFGVTSQNVHSKSSAFGLLNVYLFTKRCTTTNLEMERIEEGDSGFIRFILAVDRKLSET